MKTGVKVGLAASAVVLIIGGYLVATRVEPESGSASKRVRAASSVDVTSPVDTTPAPAGAETVPVPEVTKEYQLLPETPGVLIAPPPEKATSPK